MSVPRLLVSVRSACEAKALHESGCAIVDVKEPNNGALGQADTATIHDVAASLPPNCRMSVALGEVAEFTGCWPLPQQVSYLKLGLAGLAGSSDWRSDWLTVRQRVDNDGGCTSADWVAVIYADHEFAAAPAPDAVVRAAVETGCKVVLIDTFHKQPGVSLFDALSVNELVEIGNQSRAAGLQFAIAGQLRQQHIERIRKVEPDIVGIRGAACVGSDRNQSIDQTAVAAFLASLSGTDTSVCS